MSNKPIFVATHPRACSTAFERVFMTCRDTLQCVHEPFGDAFYYGPERLSERFENVEKARVDSGFHESTYKTIFDRIERENTENKRIFIKDITYYLLPADGKPPQIAPSLVSYRRGVGTSAPSASRTAASALSNGDASVTQNNGAAASNSDTSTTQSNGTAASNGTKSPPYPYPTAAEPGNPTVVPEDLLKQFHFTFLIRHPRSSIPSYYRCTIPPLDEMTGFYNFMPNEAGYDELRRFFDYLRNSGQVGPAIAGQQNDNNATNGANGANGAAPNDGRTEICVIDADDLLDNPSGILEAYCRSVGIKYTPSMLNWDNEEDLRTAKEAFAKWNGFHEDAIHSTELKPRTHKKKPKSDEELFAEWTEKYGEKAAKVIRDTVAQNVADYEYLKQFAIKA